MAYGGGITIISDKENGKKFLSPSDKSLATATVSFIALRYVGHMLSMEHTFV
jgi:hypothetical protein